MDAFAMGDYGAYVWSCFGLTLIVLIVCAVQAKRRYNNVYNSVRMRLRAMESQE
jgi:heme exporter protein CcmD